MSRRFQNYFCRISVPALALLAVMMCAVSLTFGADAQVGAGSTNASLTPAPGNPVRKAVLDALRQDVKDMHGLEVVFVVRHLKVKDGWAWVQAQPQLPDGANRYEDVSALLLIRDGTWEVAEMPCTEVDNLDCLDAPDYFDGLKRRFPEIPAEILPSWREGTEGSSSRIESGKTRKPRLDMFSTVGRSNDSPPVPVNGLEGLLRAKDPALRAG